MKQTNIAHGPQQVNNARARPHGKESAVLQNEPLVDQRDCSADLNTGASAEATRGHSAMATWAQSTGPQSELGKAAAVHNAFTGGHAVKRRQLIKEVNQAIREQRDWLGW